MSETGEREPQVRPHERPPHPCQNAYTNLRARILAVLTQPKQSRLLSGVQWAVRATFMLLDVPTRWLMDIGDTIIGNRGHVVIGSVLAAYFVVFGLIDAKSTQEETRASLERSLFITLVSSGNTASFVAAMKDFGPTQTMRATEHPSWFQFWDWGRAYQPNMGSLHLWARTRLTLCTLTAQDCSSDNKARLDLSRADLRKVNLAGADLSGADLTLASLADAALNGADLRGADLSNAWLPRAALSHADLRRADLRTTRLDDATYNGYTRFPDGFDPDKAGMVRVKDTR